MGEYGREQRNQLSRAIANNGAGSRQLRQLIDGRKDCFIKQFENQVVQRLEVYRAGNHVDNTYIPRHPVDTQGPNDSKNGLSTFDAIRFIPQALRAFPKQVIETSNLVNLEAKKDGHHYAIRPKNDIIRPQLRAWGETPNTPASQGFTNEVMTARTREEV